MRPKKFKKSLPGHYCLTVAEVGFAGTKNGQLLTLAENAGFDVFLTVDQSIPFEQHLVNRRIAVVVVRSKSNRLADVKQHAEACLERLLSIQPGDLVQVGDGF